MDFDAWARKAGWIVIDPEDRTQIERAFSLRTRELIESRLRVSIDDQAWAGVVTHLQNALRSLIEPPKPEEPTGLGAVVEDVNGTKWIRHDSVPISKPWINTDDCSTRLRAWSDIAAVKVLSDGVQP